MSESNERRLDELDRRGIRVAVDAPAVLEFLFDRAVATSTARELRRAWVLNIAGLLNQIERDDTPGAVAVVGPTRPEVARAS